MGDKKIEALNQFINNANKAKIEEDKDEKKVILDEREGLIERVDKILITKDGKQLLREQY
jgi:phosphoglycerate-specific signal transduction histidine kinase